MSRIDYTNEYHALLDALVTKDRQIITKAANAMGLDYNIDPISILLQLNDFYTVTGINAATSVCVLKEPHETI